MEKPIFETMEKMNYINSNVSKVYSLIMLLLTFTFMLNANPKPTCHMSKFNVGHFTETAVKIFNVYHTIYN